MRSSGRIKVLIHGKPGTGKTTLATSIAEGKKTLLLDFPGELGTASLMGLSYEDNIDVFEIQSISQINEVYKYLRGGKHPYDAVVVDSLSAAQLMFTRAIQGKDSSSMHSFGDVPPKFGFDQWGQMLEHMTELVVFLYNLAQADCPRPIDVIMTCQSKLRSDEVTGQELVVPAIRGAALDMVLAAPDYILYTFIEEELDDEDFSKTHSKYLVRLGASPTIVTKIRKSVESKALPPTVGSKKRLTLGLFEKLIEASTK